MLDAVAIGSQLSCETHLEDGEVAAEEDVGEREEGEEEEGEGEEGDEEEGEGEEGEEEEGEGEERGEGDEDPAAKAFADGVLDDGPREDSAAEQKKVRKVIKKN